MPPDASDVPRWAEGCPEDDIFVRVVEATLSPEDARALELHLDRCPDCARVMAELALDKMSSKDTIGPEDSQGDNFRLIAGQQVGRYTILERLGEGGMGVVYSAYDSRLDRRVALKFMLGSGTPRERERLRVEARALAQLTHPNVLTVHDIAEYEGELFIAAQYVEGATVDRWLAQTRRSQDEILDVFIQAGGGLAAAHARDLVHRDVKPSNLLVGAGDRVFVADFGLALSVGRSTVASSPGKGPRGTSRAGTPSYMAPEQLRGESVDARADQYSFCVALYEALLGEQPFALDGPWLVCSSLIDTVVGGGGASSVCAEPHGTVRPRDIRGHAVIAVNVQVEHGNPLAKIVGHPLAEFVRGLHEVDLISCEFDVGRVEVDDVQDGIAVPLRMQPGQLDYGERPQCGSCLADQRVATNRE